MNGMLNSLTANCPASTAAKDSAWPALLIPPDWNPAATLLPMAKYLLNRLSTCDVGGLRMSSEQAAVSATPATSTTEIHFMCRRIMV